MERLILARHGETVYSARGLLNGDPSVDVGLTAAGVEQAAELGAALAGERLDLCVTSALPRTLATADLALAGRDVPRAVDPELGDPRYGRFEDQTLDDYRSWAWSVGSAEPCPGGGESRLEIVGRLARAYRRLLERPERTILAVVHALPIAYVLRARGGAAPAARMDGQVEYAHPYRLEAGELAAALAVLEAWLAEPDW